MAAKKKQDRKPFEHMNPFEDSILKKKERQALMITDEQRTYLLNHRICHPSMIKELTYLAAKRMIAQHRQRRFMKGLMAIGFLAIIGILIFLFGYPYVKTESARQKLIDKVTTEIDEFLLPGGSTVQSHAGQYVVVDKKMANSMTYTHRTDRDSLGKPLTVTAEPRYFLILQEADTGKRFIFKVPNDVYLGMPMNSVLKPDVVRNWPIFDAITPEPPPMGYQ